MKCMNASMDRRKFCIGAVGVAVAAAIPAAYGGPSFHGVPVVWDKTPLHPWWRDAHHYQAPSPVKLETRMLAAWQDCMKNSEPPDIFYCEQSTLDMFMEELK